jgi:hypothetical protein
MLANLCGLLFIVSGSLWGLTVGSWLLGSIGSVLGLMLGALWGFHVAEGYSCILKPWARETTETRQKSHMTIVDHPERIGSSGSRWPRIMRILNRQPAKVAQKDSYDPCSLEEIHSRLKTINANLWRELRTGALSSCHAGLYTVRLNNSEESRDWREVNRRTVAALHRFETATTDQERRASLIEALDRIGEKLQLVHKAALRKADRLNSEEEREIRKNEAELWRLSRLDCLSSPQRNFPV